MAELLDLQTPNVPPVQPDSTETVAAPTELQGAVIPALGTVLVAAANGNKRAPFGSF